MASNLTVSLFASNSDTDICCCFLVDFLVGFVLFSVLYIHNHTHSQASR